jgi:large subunit ribosomal protein L54
MICRTCFRQAARLTSRQVTAEPLARTATAAATRTFTTTLSTRNAAPSPAAAAPAATSAEPSSTPDLTPLTPGAGAGDAAAAPLSSCPPGTVLSGLNYFKGKTDPVSLPDEAYPSWLWNCLEVQKKAATAADADAGDEYC